jgi:hypothetical protein
MSKRNGPLTLFDRFRRATTLRVFFLVAALLASQSSLACAFENVFAAPASAPSIVVAEGAQDHVPAVPEENSGDDCCGLCRTCTHCGGCCSFAVAVRAGEAHVSVPSILYANISFATAAPALWAPPALLRPPINAA